MNKYAQALQAIKGLGVTPFDLLAWTMARDAAAEAEAEEGVFNPTEWLEHNLVVDADEDEPVAVALTRRAQLFLED